MIKWQNSVRIQYLCVHIFEGMARITIFTHILLLNIDFTYRSLKTLDLCKEKVQEMNLPFYLNAC